MKKTKVVICVGPGGVGKTTLAAALAVRAARQGKKTLVLTIDPSHRLASTMGVAAGGDPMRVPGFEGPGELWAGVVDHRKTFDDFVKRAAEKHPGAERMLKNKLYQQLRTTLAGSQEFTALEKLYSSARDGDYDMVVLDTPPSQHAVDFLRAPAKIAMLFNESIARWFRDPQAEKSGLMRRLLNTGTRQILRVLEMLTGAEFVRELGDFFRQVETWQGKLAERTAAVQELLQSPETEFVLVGSADRGRQGEIEAFATELRNGGYRLRVLFFNRAAPEWLTATEQSLPAGLKALYQSHLELARAQERRIAAFAGRLKGTAAVIALPDWNERIYDLKGLRKVADHLDRELSS